MQRLLSSATGLRAPVFPTLWALFSFFGSAAHAQSISGCDFFPDRDVVTYMYRESGLRGTNTLEVKYVYTGEATIEGTKYRAYNKFINGAVPEVNQVTYISCGSNSLVMGNEIYVFSREVVGHMTDITKIVDIFATPVYSAEMVPSGSYYFPTLIKPNNAIGQVWTNKNAMNGQNVEVNTKVMEKDITIEIQGKDFDHVYKVSQEVWADVPFSGRQNILNTDFYFAKDIGLIRSVKKVKLMGATIETVTELYDGSSHEQLVGEIIHLVNGLPDIESFSELKTTFQAVIANHDRLNEEQLQEFKTVLQETVNSYLLNMEQQEKEIQRLLDHHQQSFKGGNIDARLIGTWEKLPHFGTSDLDTGDNVPFLRFDDVSFLRFNEDNTMEIMSELEPGNGTVDRYQYRVRGSYLETFDRNSPRPYSEMELRWSVHPKSGEEVVEFFLRKQSLGNGSLPLEVELLPDSNDRVRRYFKKIE